MELICALDLRGGRAVRLEQGDYAREAAVLDDPPATAAAWVAAGARRLHLVDLDGARDGAPANLDLLGRVVRAARDAVPEVVRGRTGSVRVQAGGGLRSRESVAAVLSTGVDDVILGTAAIGQPGFLAACHTAWPGRILASLDLEAGRVRVAGWLRGDASEPMALARRLVGEGAAGLIVTDTQRDGTLGGPNLALMREIRAALPSTRLIAAGGVGSADDLARLADAGIDGAIVGRALYDGRLTVEEALAAAAGRAASAAPHGAGSAS